MTTPTSWLKIPNASDFSLQNIPFGIMQPQNDSPRAATRIGDHLVDLAALQQLGYFRAIGLTKGIFDAPSLNGFIKEGQAKWREVRQVLQQVFSSREPGSLATNQDHQGKVLYRETEVSMLMPVEVGDYTDFYASEYHATNVGTMFRGPENALMPNWKHLPVGYHGRASSIVISDTPIRRPMGQLKPEDGPPIFGPSRLLDFELEVALVVGKETELGQRVGISEAEDHIFGLLLFNDWSARDIQKWEYVPLGPFLGKNFASSVSPWIVTMDAIEPFRVQGPIQNPPVLPYLQADGPSHFDLHLQVDLEDEKGSQLTICKSNFRHLYWSMAQQLTHHSVNGCNLRVGDLLASGTISGPEPGSFGSMLEITWRGTKPITMPDGSQRKFLLDGDQIRISGHGGQGLGRVGFGEVRGRVTPALH